MAKAREIAEFLAVAGGEDCEILGVSGIPSADPHRMCFAADEAALAAALASTAGLILASSANTDPRVLQVRNPRTAFALVYHRFFAPTEKTGIHPTAVIGEDVSIGAGSWIGPRVVLEDGVRIGRGSRLLAGVTVYSGTVIGDRVLVQAGVVLGSTGFGYVREPKTGAHIAFPQLGTLVIEDDVEIGANTTIDRGALGETRIGRGTKIDNLVHIAHNCIIGEEVLIAAQVGMAGSCVIEDRAMLGGQVGLGEKVTIGKGVILGGQGGLLPGKRIDGEGVVYWGTPAQPVREYLRSLARMRKG